MDSAAKAFRNNIRKYNSALAFTSVKYTVDGRATGGIQCFQIHGELFHLQGPLQSTDLASAQFAQLYFYDPELATNIRVGHYNGILQASILQRLTKELIVINPFIAIYKTAKERLDAESDTDQALPVLLNLQLRLIIEQGADKRRENLPTSNEIAIIIPDEYPVAGYRDIVLADRNGNNFSVINPINAAYMPLHYVLLFPRGQLGWHWALKLRNERGDRTRIRLSQRAYYRFRLHTRQDEPNTLFQAQRLFQQYLTDAWATCDQNALAWLRSNQANLRSDLYNGLADTLIQADINMDAIGQRIILPSSYTGGDHFMQQLFQDSMAIVRHFGRPTLFITFTANPKWEEISRELLPGQTAVDRPDLVARVFHLKQQELLKEIKIKNIFGRYLGCVWTIEYQKRGLPHMHLLLFLHPEDRFLSAERIDEIISAELPDPIQHPDGILPQVITSVMVHGPCGIHAPNAPCMTAKYPGGPKVCSKQYPRAFQAETIIQPDGYPLYRRQNNGLQHTVSIRGITGATTFTFDNQWVVPYNPYLSWRYKAHINVEVCASIQAIKYIHKYIYKGSDRTTLQVQSNQDEIKQYLQGQYIGPIEAIWRLFEFAMHEESPSVMHLAIHLPGQQPVYFAKGADINTVRENMESACTTLMAFFQYNATYEDGRQYLYQEFPIYYTYNKKLRCWQKRKRGTAIGRIYHCNPFMGEKYYLQLLLTTVRGLESFEHLRTVRGQLYPTFLGACRALGLLADDNEWIQCFTEAVVFGGG